MTSFWRQKPVSYFPAKPLTGCPRISRPFCTVINSNISRHLAGRGRETPTFWRETSFWRQNSRHHLSTSSPLDPIFNGESISGLKMPVSRRPCKLETTDKNTRLKCPQMGLPMTYVLLFLCCRLLSVCTYVVDQPCGGQLHIQPRMCAHVMCGGLQMIVRA